MRKSVQKIFAFLMAMVLLAPLVLVCVYASLDKEPVMLVLGDSITTGYGLANYEPGGDPYLCESYANIIADSLGLKGGSTYINKAVNGDTTGDLVELLPTVQEEVNSAELIIISIGGNDLLSLAPRVVSMVAGRELNDLDEIIDVVLSITPEKIAELAESTDFLLTLAAAYIACVANTVKIGEFLSTNAPDAEIIFLKQYNPFENVTNIGGFEIGPDLGEFVGGVIDTINGTIEVMCEKYGFTALDVPSVIDCDAAGLTNILDYDIHPNAAGHREIAKLISAHLASLPEDTKDAEVTSEPETTPEPEITTEPEPETTPEPEITTESEPETTPEPEITTEPEPETTPEPEVTTEPVTEPITEPVTEPITEPITEPVTEPITEPVTEPITEPVTEPITEPETTPAPVVTTEPETTPEPVVTTEPVVTIETVVITGYETTPYPVVTTVPETESEITTSPEVTTTPETSETVDDGCFASASAVVIVIACACTAVAFKKKEN